MKGVLTGLILGSLLAAVDAAVSSSPPQIQRINNNLRSIAEKNIKAHAINYRSNAQSSSRTASEKVVAGKSSAEIRAASVSYAKSRSLVSHSALPTTEALAPSSPQSSGTSSTPAQANIGKPDPNPDKVLVKMYMESKCPACRKFSTTYVKEILNAKGVSDIVDFEFISWGWGVVEAAPTEKQIEINPKASFADNVLNHSQQVFLFSPAPA
jgi:protein-disulfide isomerase